MDAEEPTITFTRGSTPLGKSTSPYPSTPKRVLLKAAQRKRIAGDGGGERVSPYQKRGAGGGGGGAGAARYHLRRAATTTSANLDGGGGGGGGGGMGPGGSVGPTSAPLYYPPDMHAPFAPEIPSSPHAASGGNMLGVRFNSPFNASLLRPPLAMMVEEKSVADMEREKAWFERIDVREMVESGASAGLKTADIVLLSRLETLSRQVEDIKDVLRGRRFRTGDGTGGAEQPDELERYV